MLVALKQSLKEGERVALTLVFRHSGRVHVEASMAPYPSESAK